MNVDDIIFISFLMVFIIWWLADHDSDQ